jgi:hypothetical protein
VRERFSRDELVRIANMYFSGIELNDAKVCIRFATTPLAPENVCRAHIEGGPDDWLSGSMAVW